MTKHSVKFVQSLTGEDAVLWDSMLELGYEPEVAVKALRTVHAEYRRQSRKWAPKQWTAYDWVDDWVDEWVRNRMLALADQYGRTIVVNDVVGMSNTNPNWWVPDNVTLGTTDDD